MNKPREIAWFYDIFQGRTINEFGICSRIKKMAKRYTFQCWNCPKTYFYSLDITNQQEVIVVCPYCRSEAVVDLRPNRPKLKAILRGGNQDKLNDERLKLPEILPTRKRE
jgi:DNA-directed RNA polymerase subunit RPC12/RpoP